MRPIVDRNHHVGLLIAALLLLLLHRVALLLYGDLPLDVEETYYLFWSTAPDLGYYSKPPMIAWLLAVQSALFGTGAVAVKSLSLFLHSLTTLLLFGLGRHLWSSAAGWAGALTFFSLPLIGALSVYTTTDSALHLFWALTLYLFVLACERRHWGWWLATGVAAGLGLLSKYTMGLMAIGLLGYLLSTPSLRRWLFDPRLWLGILAAALVWAPNLWWNAQHDFISFRHTADIAQLDRQLFHPDHLVEFLLPQWPVFGLLLTPLLILRLYRTGIDQSDKLLLWVSLPMLLVISLQAFLAEANLNWASPAYVGLGLLAGARIWQWHKGWLAAALLVNILFLGLVQHYHTLTGLVGVELTRKTDPYFKRLGWRELGEQLRPLLAARPDARLVSDSRGVLAYMGYYAATWPPKVGSWNASQQIRSQYDLKYDLAELPPDPLVFISKAPLPESILTAFDQVQPLGQLRISVYQDLVRDLYVYEMNGFRGYDQ